MSKPNKAEIMGEHFTGLPSSEIGRYWDILTKLIEKPLKRTDAGQYYGAADVLWKCVHKEWQCWVAWSDAGIDAVFVTYIAPFPTGFRSFVIYLVGGTKIEQWLAPAWSTFKAYAKENGCGEVTGMGRKGWLRALRRVEPEPLDEHIRFSVRLT